MSVYGGIEAGGTKSACIVGLSPNNIKAEVSFLTTTPQETIDRAVAFFQQYQEQPLAGVGIGSFGPVDLSPASPTYGYITTTPKSGWANTQFVGRISPTGNLHSKRQTPSQKNPGREIVIGN